MKTSNSKKQLALIISENGGWRWGEFGAQDGDGSVGGYGIKPEWDSLSKYWWRESLGSWFSAKKINNHHQTIVSRDEYFHLYPAQDAELVAMCADVTKENKHPEYCESVMRSIPEPSDKQTIEQLASDYKAKLEIAKRAQEEADSRRDEAEAALEKLYQAGLEIGLDIAIASDDDETETDRELVITDWRYLKVGDVIWIGGNGGSLPSGEYEIKDVELSAASQPIEVEYKGEMYSPRIHERTWRFIRRP